MKKIKNTKAKAISVIFISLFAISTIIVLNNNLTNVNTEDVFKGDNQIQDPLTSNGAGAAPWWNASYRWRKCLEITNPGSYNLTDNIMSIEIDHNDADYSSNMRANGEDLRIVENGVVRDYYVKPNLPSSGKLTIWFEVNSTAGITDYDTYMYFGNNSITWHGSAHQNEDWVGELWYKFDDGFGTRAIDSLNNYNMTLENTPTWSIDSAIGDYSLDFDGTTEYGWVSKMYGDSNELTSFSASVWFKTSYQAGGDWDNWAFLDWDRSEKFNFFITGGSPSSGGKIGFASSATGYSGQNDFFGSTTGLNDGQWHFACIVYDGTDKIIYIDNGAEDARWVNAMNGLGIGTATDRYAIIGDGSEADGIPDFPIPAYPSERNEFYYDGKMDELRYWERALTPNEITWLANYYDLSITPLTLTERSAVVTVVVKDVDGRRVSGAEVTLWNTTISVGTQTSDSNGEAVFTGILFGNYNVSVNYTLSFTNDEQIVYDSRDTPGNELTFIGLIITEHVYTDLWTIDFEVDDIDGDPLTHGYVVVNSSNQVLANLTLDSNDGTTQFVWLYNADGYNYTVYYYNRDLKIQSNEGILMNWSTAVHNMVSINYSVNARSTSPPGYRVVETKYIPGSNSSSAGREKVIDVSLTMSGMQNLDEILTYYGTPDINFYELLDYDGESTTQIMYRPLDDEITDYVYGFKFDVSGDNSSICTGQIELNLTHTHVEHVVSNMAKLSIKVIDNGPYYDPIPGVEIRIEVNGTYPMSTIIVDQATTYGLVTDSNGDAYGKVNNDLVFWYKTGVPLNISIWPTPSVQYRLRVNLSDQMPNYEYIYGYNYTINSAETIILEADVNYVNRLTRFENEWNVYQDNATDVVSGVTWGENFTLFANLSYTDGGSGGPWDSDNGSDSKVTLTIRSTGTGNPIVLIEDFIFNTNGNFTLTINSSRLSAGARGKTYIFTITAEKATYKSPNPGSFTFSIYTLSTGIKLYEYDPLDPTPDELPKYITSQYYYTSEYYGEILNITMRYYDSVTSQTLTPDTYSYTWDEGSETLIQDSVHAGYWVLQFDTTDVSESKEFTFFIDIGLENHSMQENLICKISVLEKQTFINGTDLEYDIDDFIYIFDSPTYIFNYSDADGNLIGSLDTADVTWFAKDNKGNILPSGPLTRGDGVLYETANHLHRLALNVPIEDLPAGLYKINIDIKKNFYEAAEVEVTLTIRKRPIDSGYTLYFASGSQATGIVLKLDLTDSSNNSIPLTGVTINLEIGGINYTFNEVPGTPGSYTYTLDVNSYNTFFFPAILYGTIYMEKENHETTTLAVTLTVNMIEVLGIPLFYLLMIVGSIVAVVGALGTYRYVQVRRIPSFIKKGKAIMKSISSKGSISDSNVYPPKDEFIDKMLGDRWEFYGISLSDVLGTGRSKKGKQDSEIKKDTEGGVD